MFIAYKLNKLLQSNLSLNCEDFDIKSAVCLLTALCLHHPFFPYEILQSNIQFVSTPETIRDLSHVLTRFMAMNVRSAVADDIAYVDRSSKQLMRFCK